MRNRQHIKDLNQRSTPGSGIGTPPPEAGMNALKEDNSWKLPMLALTSDPTLDYANSMEKDLVGENKRNIA